jgi:hypothetical protein
MDDSPETAAFLPHKPGKREKKLGPRPPLPPATFISLTLLCLVSLGSGVDGFADCPAAQAGR